MAASKEQKERVTAYAPQAQEIMKETGISASLILAQMALETAWLSSFPPNSNNPFGVKAKKGEPYVTAWTSEYENGKKKRVEANFRKYNSILEALRDHAARMQTARYRDCLGKPYQEAARILQQNKYATDPDYAKKLIDVIEINGLAVYDRLLASPTYRKSEIIRVINTIEERGKARLTIKDQVSELKSLLQLGGII